MDAETFEDAAAAARRSREPAAYRAALELYAGDLLPEDRYETWAEESRGELRQLYLALLVEMSRICEEREDYEPAVEALRRVVSEEPTREEAHQGLMRLHALRGGRREAILQYERLRKYLFQKLQTEPDAASRRLYEDVLADRLPRAHPGLDTDTAETLQEAAGNHNLPNSPSSFVGRERDMVEIKRSLAMTQLLTLTGSGGSGKTRLALEVARDLVGIYPDGVWLVELAPLSDPALVPNAVAATLGVLDRPDLSLTDTLADSLGSRRILLVLDNCEHLIDACARLVDTLLRSCEHLRVLATSREALGIAGETNWLVPSLTVPDAGRLPAARSLPRYEAVRLFVERARSRLPAFELTSQNSRAVVEVCRRLDGIPLAIELATARMTALAVEQIAEKLEDSLKLLTGGSRTAEPRQQTLRAALAWSHDLLSEAERVTFRRLSVFAGGWTLEAAEEVCSASSAGRDEVLNLLSRLVDKSLVVASLAEAGGDGVPWYRMLEPVRQYGWEQLENAGETAQVRERHAGYYLVLAEEAEPGLIAAGQVAWLERLATEYGNLRAALNWCLDEEGAEPEVSARMGLRLAAAVGRFWGIRGPSEGREWLEKGLAKSGASPAPLRAKTLREAGFIAIYQLDPQAIAMLEESLDLFKELGDKMGQAISINYLQHAIGILGYRERVPTLRAEAEALLEEPLGDRRAAAHLQLTLGMMGMLGQGPEQGVVRIEEALALFREVGDLRSCAQCLTVMGIAAVGRGDAGLAARVYEDTLRLLRQLKDKIGIFYSLVGAAGVAVLRDRTARAARLFGAAEALRKAIGYPAQPLKQLTYDYEGFLATTRAGLGETAFEAAFSEGQAMSPERAIEYALSADEPAPSTASVPKESPPALSRREREVALLIARGLSNRRIAGELAISERTVTTHVDHILSKLGATSRARVAAWVVEQRLLPEEESPG